ELGDAALELGDRRVQRGAGRLGQLADADERLREQPGDARDEVVARPRPLHADPLVALVVAHGGRPRREDRHVGAALAEQPELVLLDRPPDLVVGDGRVVRCRAALPERGELPGPPVAVRAGSRRVVPVAVDDHSGFPGEVACGRRMWSMTAARSGSARASAWPAARSWRSDAASDISGSTPPSSTVAAASAISSERRRPCRSEREMKYVATSC